MPICTKYFSFKDFETQEAKRIYILNELINVSSEEYLSSLFANNELQMIPSRPYKDAIGCPVVYIGKSKPTESKRDQKLGRRCFREINGRFPLLSLKNIIKNQYEKSI